jgi:hypothetical protein
MPLANPVTKKALGQKVAIVMTTAPAAGTGIPTLTEANAATSKFISLHLYGDLSITASQNTGEGPRKMGSQFTPTQLGQVNYPAVEAQYSYDPQKVGTAAAPGNEAYEALVPGTTRTVIILNGVDGTATTALTSTMVVDVYLMQCGVYRKGSTGDGEFDELSVTQSLIVAGGSAIAENVKLV